MSSVKCNIFRSSAGIRRYRLLMSLAHYICCFGTASFVPFENGFNSNCLTKGAYHLHLSVWCCTDALGQPVESLCLVWCILTVLLVYSTATLIYIVIRVNCHDILRHHPFASVMCRYLFAFLGFLYTFILSIIIDLPQ